jgi:hypothetical protein
MSTLCILQLYLIVLTIIFYTDDTDDDQLCTSTNRLVQFLQTNKYCNDRVLRLNLVISPLGGGVESNPDKPAVVE